jgi:hypothetical protein
MWQKCPICLGSGIVFTSSGTSHITCSVCNGRKIISELTGLPPVLLIGKEGLDLKMLDEKLDKALNSETEKSMSDFLENNAKKTQKNDTNQ